MIDKLFMLFFAIVGILNIYGFMIATSYTFTIVHSALLIVCLYEIKTVLKEL